MFRCLLLLLLFHSAAGHADMGALPLNSVLGVPGYPDCVRRNPMRNWDVEKAAADLRCSQKSRQSSSVKIACVGDSITAGVHSSGGDHPYPQQLQLLLDKKYGAGQYDVTNLGACGSTMLKRGNSPYWQRPQFKALTDGRWDIVTIMLGTNDAKDPGDHGPNNWLHNCGGVSQTTLEGCTFAEDYRSMIETVKSLGRQPGVAPDIYIMIPPPLMELYSYGMNQTVINSVYPKLVPLIQQNNTGLVMKTIDIYSGMGGETNWRTDSRWPQSCALNSTWSPCSWWCDQQSCDQCHPNDSGYSHLANVLLKSLDLRKFA